MDDSCQRIPFMADIPRHVPSMSGKRKSSGTAEVLYAKPLSTNYLVMPCYDTEKKPFLEQQQQLRAWGGGRLPQPHTDKPPLITPSSPNSSCEASRDSSKTTIPFRRHVQSVALFGGNLHGPLAVDGALGLIYVAGYSYCFARWSTERELHVSCTQRGSALTGIGASGPPNWRLSKQLGRVMPTVHVG